MNYIMKMVKSLKEANLFIKRVSDTVKDGIKEQRGGFLGIS